MQEQGAPSDADIAALAQEHIATGYAKMREVCPEMPEYADSEQFARIKAFARALLARHGAQPALREYASDQDFHENASTAELGAWQRGWNDCDASQPAASAEPVGLQALLSQLPGLRENPREGDAVFRCGFNGALDTVAARIRNMLAAPVAAQAQPQQPVRGAHGLPLPKHPTVDDAPDDYSSGEKAAWVTGWHECRHEMIGALRSQPSGNAGELDERVAFDDWFRGYQYLPDDADTTQYDEAFLAFKAWRARAALAAQASGQAQDAALLDALAQAEAGLVFAGAEQMQPTGDFAPTPLLALRHVRAALAGRPLASHDAEDVTARFMRDVDAELRRAREKFPGDRIMTIALAEEFGELAKAMLDESGARVWKEAVQTAVMAARVAIDGDSSVDEWRAAKGLDNHRAAIDAARQESKGGGNG
ncbi:hypothetical protein RAN3_2490 [plant metagenome]|uniref:Uncharacterized protein n=1 Tax=plant metagenome TaxID=1297885 RepID=A0A484U4G9_9ZZZZ